MPNQHTSPDSEQETDDEAARRRGEALLTGELRLTLAEVAELLTAASPTPLPPLDLAPYADAGPRLLWQLWGDLQALRPDLAHQAWENARSKATAHPWTLVNVTEILTTNKENTP